ncbi:MAG TPA: hypothetical protein EYQ25_03410 [Planctomycetes bacterium]|nr:hypothetical protein [Planctomycetota bacterium]HIL36962.1 hypothetical protein [Planctomycetota bacterium]
MATLQEEISLPDSDGPVAAVSAWWDPGDTGRAAILLAHGAGADCLSPFMLAISRALVTQGLGVLRFRYAYSERMAREERRMPPDRTPRLEKVHELALERLALLAPNRPLVLGGKSLGSRMGSHLAAKGADVRALFHLGFPLHPVKKPGVERAQHFRAIPQPALFLQGTRDPLCELELLRGALDNHGGPVSLTLIEGAGHDFKLRKRDPAYRTEEETLEFLASTIDKWIATTLGA